MCFIVTHVENYLLQKVLESLKKCINRQRPKREKQMIKIKTMISYICITLLIVTFSVIIASNYQIVI